MANKGSNRRHKAAQLGEQKVMRGTGGETHQVAGNEIAVLTTQQGIPVADDQNSLKLGSRGPTALEDFHLREKIFHFDHERIPERVVHARGFGAHGYFENYDSLAEITKADLFQRRRRERPRLCAFRPSPATRARPTWPATCADLRSSSIPKKAIGTSSGTTCPCSSSRTRSSFPILSMPPRRNRTAAFRRHRQPMITSGISSH